MKTTMRKDVTTVELLESFWKIHWDSYSPTSRTTRRGRLVVMAASLLDDRVSAPGIIAELKRQNVRGTERPDATSLEAWVARYLLDCFLPAPEHSSNVWKSPDSAELLEAATWIRSHSKPAREITHEDLVRFRAYMGGTAYHTLRSYWAHIEKVIHWAIISGYLDERLPGRPAADRAPTGRRANRPGPSTQREDRCGPSPTPAGSSRASGSKSLCCSAPSGLCASAKSSPCGAGTSDAWCTRGCGSPSTVRSGDIRGGTRTTARRRRTLPLRREDRPASAGRRRCYVPKRVALEILEYVDSRMPDQLLFLNSYGRPMSTDHLPGCVEQGHQDRAGRSALCRHHPTCHAPCGDVHVATARAGPEVDSELGRMAFTHRDARHLRRPLAGGGGGFDRPT